MMKPLWRKAPKWAGWLAQDKNGDWCFFRDKPILGAFHWLPASIPDSGNSFEYADEDRIGQGDTNNEWKNTLEAR